MAASAECAAYRDDAFVCVCFGCGAREIHPNRASAKAFANEHRTTVLSPIANCWERR